MVNSRLIGNDVPASVVTAVPQLLYSEATAAEWLFHQEKATLLDAREGT
jgi:hypothetical protein